MRILISAYTGLGNFILKTPMIKKIKCLYPTCKIDIITGNSFGTEFILQGTTLIDKTYILKENASFIEKYQFFSNLKKEKYDAIFLAFDTNRKFLFFGSFLANIKTRIVHINIKSKIKTIFFFMMPKTLIIPLLQGRHEIDLNYDLLEAYINKPIERDYKTLINRLEDENLLIKFSLESKKYIVLQVGAANGAKSSKKWSITKFKKLIQELNIKYKDYKIVTVGDNGDYESDIIQLENSYLTFTNTAGMTTINEVANILFHSKIVVANDSGIMHMANALDCNLIALYGPTDYTRTKPLGTNNTVLYSKTDCFCKMYNFSGNEIKLLEEYPNCMDGITVEDVMQVINKVFDDK